MPYCLPHGDRTRCLTLIKASHSGPWSLLASRSILGRFGVLQQEVALDPGAKRATSGTTDISGSFALFVQLDIILSLQLKDWSVANWSGQ